MVKRLLNSLLAPRIKIGSTRSSGPSQPTRLQLSAHPDTLSELKRTRRKKTVAFSVSNNRIKILAPKRLALYQIQQLLHKRSDWIGRQLEYQASLPDEPEELARQYIDGDSVKYLGRRYRLTINSSARSAHSVKLCSGKLLVTLTCKCQHPAQNPDQNRDEIKSAIGHWYHQRAEERLPKIVAQLAAKIGVNYGDIEIRHFKSRWGSCRADGRLQFNWRLMMAPSKVIEYVVVHELCHRIHLNHSRAFWGEVERHMPEFQQHRKWLKTDGHLLIV
ncbi:MAG: DUF45 domain-containing protein [Gammaproteobacteria bacterium]|nr:DUF45 domain-containing protein [Gammaproteobacteria bacterium]